MIYSIKKNLLFQRTIGYIEFKEENRVMISLSELKNFAINIETILVRVHVCIICNNVYAIITKLSTGLELK